MTDFTKEELEEIRVALIVFGIGDCGSILFGKIQSMIDNYCDHVPHGDFHECVDRCKKCGVICNDN